MKVIQHSADVLKVALISKEPQLAKLYEAFEPKEKLLLNEAFRPNSVLFKPITLHSDSDWISSHPEPTQDFAQFYHDPCRNRPSSKKSLICIQPIGAFGDSRVSTDVYMNWLKDYCEAFYYGLTVRILGPVPVSHTGCAFRINEYTDNLQIHAGHLLNFLKKKKAKDAFCIVGITMIDLYPKDSWNFVFGQASLTEDASLAIWFDGLYYWVQESRFCLGECFCLFFVAQKPRNKGKSEVFSRLFIMRHAVHSLATRGVGIFSFARYDSDFYSANYKGQLKTSKKLLPTDYSVFDGYYTPEITSLLLLRSCKTLTHEIGHIFGLHHCQWLQCVMQGSNHLEESDRRPLYLCPICLRKLQSALGFKIVERYKALQRWMEDEASATKSELSDEASLDIQKPVAAFKESYDWIVKCLGFLQK